MKEIFLKFITLNCIRETDINLKGNDTYCIISQRMTEVSYLYDEDDNIQWHKGQIHKQYSQQSLSSLMFNNKSNSTNYMKPNT